MNKVGTEESLRCQKNDYRAAGAGGYALSPSGRGA